MSKAEEHSFRGAVDGGLRSPDGTWAGGSKNARQQLKEAREEIAALRKRLDMTEPANVTDWESFGTPRIRAEAAARALYQSNCNPVWAMKLLGFEANDARDKTIQNRILRSDAVMEILESIFQPPKEIKRAIMERSQENAMLGTDEVSIRATAQLAKLAGWVKPETTNVNVQTLVGLMNPGTPQEKKVDQIASDDALSILGHEPGEPIRISTGDKAVERALAESDE